LENKPEEMVILMQKEVGDKICEKKWYNHSYLSLAIEFSCEIVREVCFVGKENFIPAPRIDSSALYFKRKEYYDAEEAKKFLSTTRAWFSAPRKKVLSNLANTLHISKNDLQQLFNKLELLETARAEEMDIQKWKEIMLHI
jgi:16S rRNA (adenine1518-N6/adenine1519-N6)-dimethyltransferase